MGNHLAATLIRRQLLQPRFFAIEHANACGSIDFMTTEHKEIAIHLLHIDLEMGCALRPINHHGNGIFMGNADDFVYRIDGAQHIAYLRNADDFGALVDHVAQRLHVHSPVIVHRNHAQHDAFSRGLQLPRHDVRMVFYG